MKIKAVLDANVLYSFFSRDLLLSLFAAKLYEAKWTDRINAEWIGHLLENNPDLSPDNIARTVKLMNQIKPNPVVSDYEHLEPKLELPDADDRHVLAAAVAVKAHRIITWNLKDFPERLLQKFGITPQSPDHFVEELIKSDPESTIAVLRDMRQRLQRPSMDADGFLQALDRANMKRTKGILERYKAKL